ncbi:helix-turn-helix transcriptional regulator [Nautilia lithotrophica]
MKDKKVFNILQILKDLSKLNTICTKEYAQKMNVSVRTIQRYLEDISEFFDIELVQESRGCYKFLNFEKVREILLNQEDYEDFEKFANIVSAFNPNLLKYFNVEEKLLKKIIDDELFYIKISPFEEIMNFSLFQKVKKAIKYSQTIDVEYEGERLRYFENLRPHKIVFAEGNWYLVTQDDEELNGGVKFLRLNFIKKVNLKSKEFKKNRELLKFIENFQSLMSAYDKPKFEVIVFVDQEVERHFKAKKFLDSQTIVKDTKEGLILKYYINDENEILLLAKEWMPYMKIISPSHLQDKLENIAKEILD